MTLITYKPKRTVANEIDNWFDNLWNFNYPLSYREKFQPQFNISQNKTSYFITADLPGINKKDIDISLTDEMITISGERKLNENHDDEFSRYNNIQYGSFEKSFQIPDDANIDKINARMDSGVLTLEIKKAKKIPSDIKKISIK
jgi:HSP20 family protein